MGPRDVSDLMLDFEPTASFDDLAGALKRVLDLNGCPACGRLSLHLRALDDPVVHEFGEIKTLKGVFELAPQVAVQTGIR